jgi:hypothetical protein
MIVKGQSLLRDIKPKVAGEKPGIGGLAHRIPTWH